MGRVAVVLAVVAAVSAGCGPGGQSLASQTPAVISGTVVAGPGCPPSGGGVAQPCLVRNVPAAVVAASGKDGVHQVRADGTGHYQLSLLAGEWSLRATGPDGVSGPAVQLFLDPGQEAHLDLRAG